MSEGPVATSPQVWLLVGSGRSGTTLLYELLCADPDHAWMSNWSQRVPALAALHPRGARSGKGGGRLSIRPVEGYRRWDRIDAAREPAAAWARARRDHLRGGRQRLVNKNTRNTGRLDRLAELEPAAYVVHLHRHPLAVVGSMIHAAFFPTIDAFWRDGRPVHALVAEGVDPAVLAAELWRYETDRCRTDLASWAGPTRTIAYEDLAADPTAVVADVYRHVGGEVPAAVGAAISAARITDRNADCIARLTGDQRAAAWSIVEATGMALGYRFDEEGWAGAR